MKSLQKGFTLIELMIVVAIIGILAAIAIPAYSTYQAKAKLSAGLAEVSAAKTVVETKINDGTAITNNASTGLPASSLASKNCTLTTTMVAAGTGTIACAIVAGPPQVAAATITWTRDATGAWTCATAGATDATLSPKSCPQ